LACKDFLVKQSFNKSLKFLKILKDFRFVFEQIDPSKLAIDINKTDIIFITAYGLTSRTPNNREDKLQRRFRHTRRFGIG
jgi:hypothetical protein